MHNNSNFNKQYEEDAIIVPDRSPILLPDYNHYKENPKESVPCDISPANFRELCWCHIELLHHVHDVIQKRYFEQKRSYGYKRAKKKIEWGKLLRM